jgi:metallo-beta-lactamase class B
MVPHPDAIDFLERAQQRSPGEKIDPLVNSQACKAYAAKGWDNLDRRIAKEAAQVPAH